MNKSIEIHLEFSSGRAVTWKPIWKPKFSLRVAFFVWAAVMGRILTIDNLRVLVVDWCCMCNGVVLSSCLGPMVVDF